MKIESASARSVTNPLSAKRASLGQHSGFAAELTSSAKESAGLTGMTMKAPALLAQIEETADALARRQRRRSIERAHLILDRLEEIRLGLLLGEIPASELDTLIGLLQTQKHALQDSNLLNLLNEIEVRAKVELAKISSRQA